MNSKIKKVKCHLKRYGFIRTVKKCTKKLLKVPDEFVIENEKRYKILMQENELIEEELKRQKEYFFEFKPKISIVVPMYNTKEEFFKELIKSVLNQTYSNWELCLADGSEEENENLKQYYENEGRIKYKFLNKNSGISENTNEAIKMSTGEYIGFLDHDDLLSLDALFEVVKVINDNMDAHLIYTDEDKIDENMKRFDPHFKPDFSPEMLECNNYITHFVIVRREIIDEVGLLDSRFDGAQDFDLLLRIMENTNKVLHIPKVLYHWRVHKTSTANVADAKPYAYVAGKLAVEEHLKRTGKEGTVEFTEVPGIYRINFDVIGNPKVSILIPNKDNIKLLSNCINSILEKTTYENYEIVIIENNSENDETFKFYKKIESNRKIKVIKYNEKEINYYRLINFGVENSESDFILQLNNDTKILSRDWLETFIGYAQNEEIGVVGARLYFEDMSIYHAGISYGIGGSFGNLLENLPFGKHAYYARETATRNVSAITENCLFARRQIYEEIYSMDACLFNKTYSGVDFCLKILEKGYRLVYNPYVELIHHKSKIDEYKDTLKKQEESNFEDAKFKEKWKEVLEKYDPYYNPNFSQNHHDFRVK